jgi:hypothetical protein
MRILFLLFLLAPVVCSAQINKSATELAREKVQEYVVNKLLITPLYESSSYGELKPQLLTRTKASWGMECRFETQKNSSSGLNQAYRMFFYFDKRMKIVRAESYELK